MCCLKLPIQPHIDQALRRRPVASHRPGEKHLAPPADAIGSADDQVPPSAPVMIQPEPSVAATPPDNSPHRRREELSRSRGIQALLKPENAVASVGTVNRIAILNASLTPDRDRQSTSSIPVRRALGVHHGGVSSRELKQVRARRGHNQGFVTEARYMGRTVTTSGQFSDSSLTGVPPPAALMRSLELARFALCFFVFWDGGAFRRGEMRVVQVNR